MERFLFEYEVKNEQHTKQLVDLLHKFEEVHSWELSPKQNYFILKVQSIRLEPVDFVLKLKENGHRIERLYEE